MPDADLKTSAAEFVTAFEEVFGSDWDRTRFRLQTPPLLRHYIMPGATFLEPGVTDEHADWHHRGVLLEKYRRLRQALSEADH